MKSFFFQVLYCGYKSFGRWIFTKGRNPHGRNENSNTIYSSDPAHGSDASAGAHSRTERKEAWKDSSRSFSDIDHMYGIYVNGGSRASQCPMFPGEPFEFVKVLLVFPFKPFNHTVWHSDININKRDILVHPIISFLCMVCRHQHFPTLLVIYCCFFWHCLKLPHALLIFM